MNCAPAEIFCLLRVAEGPAGVFGSPPCGLHLSRRSRSPGPDCRPGPGTRWSRRTHHCPHRGSAGSSPSPAARPRNGYPNPRLGRRTPVTRQNTGNSCKGLSIPGPFEVPGSHPFGRSNAIRVWKLQFLQRARSRRRRATDVKNSRPQTPNETGAKYLCSVLHSSDCSLAPEGYIGRHESPDETYRLGRFSSALWVRPDAHDPMLGEDTTKIPTCLGDHGISPISPSWPAAAPRWSSIPAWARRMEPRSRAYGGQTRAWQQPAIPHHHALSSRARRGRARFSCRHDSHPGCGAAAGDGEARAGNDRYVQLTFRGEQRAVGWRGVASAGCDFYPGSEVDLGGVTARLLWYGGAHTKGDELTFVEPDRTLVSGDVVQNKTMPNIFGDGGTPATWLAVLDKSRV